MNYALRGLVCATLAASSFAPVHATQVAAPQPVSWSVTLDAPAGPVAAGGTFTAVVKAAIEDGWHVYTPDELPNGPRPLRIEIPAGQPFTVSGKLAAPEAEREFDPAFEQVTAFYKSDSVFRLPVAIAAGAAPGPAVLNLEVSFQACDGRLCLPGRTVRLALPVTIAAAAPGRPATAASGPLAVRDRLIAALDAWHKAGQFPGATAGIAFADGTSMGLATGVSDRDTGRRMDPTDLMLMGSVGKTFVSAVALQLIHEKKLALQDPLSKYFGTAPWFSRLPNATAITVRHLMTHTSGLVRYEFKEQFTADLTRQPAKVWTPEERLAYILDSPPPFAPGAGWEYSDTNYIVLGMIIEKVTGSTYYAQMQSRLLKPLGLSRIVPADRMVIPGLVQGYAGPNNPFGGTDAMMKDGALVINPQLEWTGGGLASSAEDLARWARLLYEGRAFDAALLPEFLNGVPAKLGPDTKYGLGVIIRPTPFGESYGHSGFFPGYVTDVMYFPSLKTAIAVQVNSSAPRATGRPLPRVIYELAEIIKNGTASGAADGGAASAGGPSGIPVR